MLFLPLLALVLLACIYPAFVKLAAVLFRRTKPVAFKGGVALSLIVYCLVFLSGCAIAVALQVLSRVGQP